VLKEHQVILASLHNENGVRRLAKYLGIETHNQQIMTIIEEMRQRGVFLPQPLSFSK